MDLAQLAGLDYADVEIAGATYRVGELTQREWAAVQAWIKATVPGPLSSLASPDFKSLPSEVKRDLLAVALEQDRTSWPPAVGRTGWFAALDHPGGHAVLLMALLKKHRPSIAPAECEGLAEKATILEIMPAVLAGLGVFGPKSPTPAGREETRAGARRRTTSGTGRSSSPRRGAGPGTSSST